MLTTKTPQTITVTLGSVNAFQIVRATIECPADDQVSVVLDVQGATIDDNGTVSGAIPLPQVVLPADVSAAIYAAVRELLYGGVQNDSLTIPSDAVLSPVAVAKVAM